MKMNSKVSFVKKFKNNPFVFFTLSFILGLLWGINEFSILIPLFISVLGIVLLFTSRKLLFITGIMLCMLSFGWQIMSKEINNQKSNRLIANQIHENIISFSSIVLDIQATEKGFKYLVNLDEHKGIGAWFYHDEKINCAVGDFISGTGKFNEISPVRNPGEFDFQKYFNRQNIYGWIFAEDFYPIQIGQNKNFQLKNYIFNIREKIRHHFQRITPGISASLLSALILGDKSEVEPSIRESFAETGVIHVLAVSGLHVGYVLIILLLLKNILRLPWGWDRIVVIMGLFFFVLLTGGKASVVRASFMAGLYVLAPLVNRQVNIWNIISAAAFFILCFNPLDLFDLGFQLSFIAVISIVFFYNWFNAILPEKMKVQNVEHKSIQFIWGLFLVSFAAQLGTLPLTSYVFGKIPIIALIANVFIVPLIGLLVGVGFFILFLGWLPVIGYALGNSAWFLSKMITSLTYTFSSIPYSSFKLTFTPFYFLIYLIILIAVIFISNSARRKYGILCLAFVGNFLVWNWALETRKIDIIFLDVGQGDAAVVLLPNNKTMLIDAGQRNQYEDMGKEVILPVLKHLNIKKLNWVVMSHPHSDHIGGIVSIINEVEIDTLWDSYISYTSWTYKTIINEALDNNIEIIHPRQGQVVKLSGNVFVEFFAPDSVFAVTERNVNNASIVFKLTYGKTSILFTGDLEHEGDQFLLPYEKMLKSDVLKVAHHGSITSSTPSLLDIIQPELAVVSVGRNNKFNHPSQIVMDRFNKRKIKIHRTDKEGALWLRSNGMKIKELPWH